MCGPSITSRCKAKVGLTMGVFVEIYDAVSVEELVHNCVSGWVKQWVKQSARECVLVGEGIGVGVSGSIVGKGRKVLYTCSPSLLRCQR